MREGARDELHALGREANAAPINEANSQNGKRDVSQQTRREDH